MSVAVIIALSYHGGDGRSLPGVIHDSSRMVALAQSQNLAIVMLTDDVAAAEHCGVTSAIVTSELILTTIRHCLGQYRNLLIYFSGHGHRGALELHDSEILKVKDIYRLICDVATRDQQLLILNDCCNGSSWGLPFVLTGTKWQCRKGNYLFCPATVISMSSSSLNELSTATDAGSVFTRSYYDLWKNGKYPTYRQLAETLGVKLFASIPDSTCFAWLEQPSDNTTSF